MVHITDANFVDEVEKFDGVVLVDFWADWCTPCHMIAPIVEELDKEYAGNAKIKIAKLDTDANPQVAQMFQVMSIPTLIVFKNGQPAGSVVGVQPKENIVEVLKAAM